jgi:ariadne-1
MTCWRTMRAASPTEVRLSRPSAAPLTVAGSDDDLDLGESVDDFGAHDKIIQVQKPAYEVDYSCFSPPDIDASQSRLITEVKDVLGQPPEATAILLRYFRWNREKLIEAYMEHQADVLESAGLGDDEASKCRLQKIPGFGCDICCDDDPDISTFALTCGHRYCVGCYTTYVVTKIKNEGNAARIKCPGDACNRIVDSKSLELLVPAELKDR